MKKKVCYIISDIHKSLAFEWTAIGLREKYDLSFILLNPGDSALESFLVNQGIRVNRIKYAGKKDFPIALLKTYRLLKQQKPDVVHCHLFDAQLIGLTGAWMAGIKKRIYTRHTSMFHLDFHPGGVKYDKWSNARATHVVSISQATDFALSVERADKRKIVPIPHGFDFKQLTDVSDVRVAEVRKKWNIAEGKLVVGVIARYIEWKGVQFIVRAFSQFVLKNPSALLVLANAAGPDQNLIEEELKHVPSNAVIQIKFEEDVAALYRTFSVYVHTPIDFFCEAFGQTYVEALAMGVPSVFTLSGIAPAFIKDFENALVVESKNSVQILEAINRLADDPQLRERLIKKGKEDVFSRFGIEKMTQSLEELYDE